MHVALEGASLMPWQVYTGSPTPVPLSLLRCADHTAPVRGEADTRSWRADTSCLHSPQPTLSLVASDTRLFRTRLGASNLGGKKHLGLAMATTTPSTPQHVIETAGSASVTRSLSCSDPSPITVVTTKFPTGLSFFLMTTIGLEFPGK